MGRKACPTSHLLTMDIVRLTLWASVSPGGPSTCRVSTSKPSCDSSSILHCDEIPTRASPHHTSRGRAPRLRPHGNSLKSSQAGQPSHESCGFKPAGVPRLYEGGYEGGLSVKGRDRATREVSDCTHTAPPATSPVRADRFNGSVANKHRRHRHRRHRVITANNSTRAEKCPMYRRRIGASAGTRG